MASEKLSQLPPAQTLTGAELVYLAQSQDGTPTSVSATLSQLGDVVSPQYHYSQPSPSNAWVINHGLNGYPDIRVVDTAGNLLMGQVAYITANQVTVQFSAALVGDAYLSL